MRHVTGPHADRDAEAPVDLLSDRARETTTTLAEATDGTLTGADNEAAAADCVNLLGFDKQGAFALPVEEGSATQQAAALLPDSAVVGAFHHVSAVLLEDPEVGAVETDVLVVGDDREATDLVRASASAIPGMRGAYAGVRVTDL